MREVADEPPVRFPWHQWETTTALAEQMSDGGWHEAARYVVYLARLLDAVAATHAGCNPAHCPTIAALNRAADAS